MKITHIGHSCFLIEGAKESFLIDPYDDSIGIRMPQLAAGYLLVSHEHYDHNNHAVVSVRHPDAIPPGVRIINSFHDDKNGAKRGTNKIHVIDIDGQKVCHLGDLGQVLTDQQIAEIGAVDVLLIPVGGNYTIDAAQAITVCKQLSPQLVIPMHYKTLGVTLDIAPVDGFARLAEQSGLSIIILDPGESYQA